MMSYHLKFILLEIGFQLQLSVTCKVFTSIKAVLITMKGYVN